MTKSSDGPISIRQEHAGKCYWCSLNNGRGTPAYRVLRDMGDYKIAGDICEGCFEAFGGLACRVIEVIQIY